jgi:hypothetical protein
MSRGPGPNPRERIERQLPAVRDDVRREIEFVLRTSR